MCPRTIRPGCSVPWTIRLLDDARWTTPFRWRVPWTKRSMDDASLAAACVPVLNRIEVLVVESLTRHNIILVLGTSGFASKVLHNLQYSSFGLISPKVSGHIGQRRGDQVTHCPRDASSKGRLVQGTVYIRDFSFGDRSVGDELTVHRSALALTTVGMYCSPSPCRWGSLPGGSSVVLGCLASTLMLLMPCAGLIK